MFRPITPQDKDVYLAFTQAFYRSPAVLHPVPEERFEKTFETVIGGSPYADAFLFETDGTPAGYALLSKTYSNEAGGLVVWIEELFILPEYRSRGLGSSFLAFAEAHYRPARIRLEVEAANRKAIRLYERMGFRPLSYLQMYKENE